MDLSIDGIGSILAAIAALGTAAFGLVDALKALPHGGLSRLGFKHIRAALQPYAPCLDQALGNGRWLSTLRAYWVNGRPLDEQKAAARSLIRLGLTAATVPKLPDGLNIDKTRLQAVAGKLETGEELTEADLNLLGRLDATIEAELQAAYDYADQGYRAAARAWAGALAIVLAVFATIVWRGATLQASDFALALLVGLLAVPIAPIAKDLSSAIAAGARAVAAVKGG